MFEEEFLDEEYFVEHLKKCQKQFLQQTQEGVKNVVNYVYKPTPRQCCQQNLQCFQTKCCANIVCLIIFMIFFLSFLTLSVVIIVQSLSTETMKNFFWIGLGLLAFTILFAFLFMCCTCINSKCSQIIILFGVFITNILLLGLAYILYSQQDNKISGGGSLPFFILSALYSIIICFYFEDIKRANNMLQIISIIMQKSRSINKIAIFMLLYSFLLTYLWSISFLCFKYWIDQQRYKNGYNDKEGYQNVQRQDIYILLSILWTIYYIFILLHTHYVSTFLSASSFAYWYYQYPKDITQKIIKLSNQQHQQFEIRSQYQQNRPISNIMEEQHQPQQRNNNPQNLLIERKNYLFLQRKKDNERPFISSFKYMLIALGTISYATYINPIMIFVKLVNGCAKLSKCCECDNLKRFNRYSKAQIRTYFFNDFTIIISALTGQSYLKSSNIQAHCSNLTDDKNEEYIENEAIQPTKYMQKSLFGFKSVQKASLLFRFAVICFVSSITTLLILITFLVMQDDDKINQIKKNLPFLVTGPLAIFFASTIIVNNFFQCYINLILSFYMIYRLDTKITFHKQTLVRWYKQNTKECKTKFDQIFIGTIPDVPNIKYIVNPRDQSNQND